MGSSVATYTSISAPEIESAIRLAIAALIGLAVGLEREWSGHATGPQGRFAGLRTFLLLGMVGGAAGLLSWWGYQAVGVTLVGGGALFVATAYAMAVRRPDVTLDGTTEGAALLVLALGVFAGVGQLALASGAVAVVVFALGEKERLHWLVRRIGEREMRATLQFAVLALVVLPLLPEGPFGPLGGVRPRALWGVVLFMSGLNFAGYLARRGVGPQRGYGLIGLFGGIVSSTAVTLQFSRMSNQKQSLGPSLALGVIAACTVLLPRIAIVSSLLNPSVAKALLLYLLPPAVVGIGILAIALRRNAYTTDGGEAEDESTPLRLWSAIQMAGAFQLSIMGIALARELWGSPGVIATAAALGLTDMDALTVSMNRLGGTDEAVGLAAQGIGVGLLTNTVFKLGLALALGRGKFRAWTATGLIALAAATALGIWFAGRP